MASKNMAKRVLSLPPAKCGSLVTQLKMADKKLALK